MSKVTIIPATLERHTSTPIGTKTKKRVCAYARVSTDSDDQENSFEAQQRAYRKIISENQEWEFVGIYADEGITGTSLKNRKQFNKMMEDALHGKIDIIINKSISRFGRNTVDTLNSIRKLTDKGVDVYFEKENMHTLNAVSEFVFTIFASMAQEESRSISANVTMGKRWGMQEGKVSWAYSKMLGYRKGENGIEVIPEEAEIVRTIYRMFLAEHKTINAIKDYLNDNNIPTPSKKPGCKWTYINVLKILTNEKYAGNAILQKTYVSDFLQHKTKVNKGELPKYHVKNSHPFIVLPEEWEEVQLEIGRRKKTGVKYSGTSIFSSKIICGDCGDFYGQKIWHSNDKYRSVRYRCNSMFENEKQCKTPILKEETIKESFLKAYEQYMSNKENLVEDLKHLRAKVDDIEKLQKEVDSLKIELDIVTGLIENLVKGNASKPLDQEQYEKEYNSYVERYTAADKKQKELLARINVQRVQLRKLDNYINSIETIPGSLPEFDDNLFLFVIDKIVVDHNGDMAFYFFGGKSVVIKS